MIALQRCLLSALVLVVLAGCGEDAPPPALEIIAAGAVVLSVSGEGELKSAKATPLKVPGSQWAARQLVWMLAEGSVVRKGEVLARFSADQGQQDLAQAMIDLQRNALARAAKQTELQSGQGRVAVDLAQVAGQLGIARRYAGADLDTLARNAVLDAVQDAEYLNAKQGTLQWRRGQFGVRGGAELAVLDAQRATYDINARTRQDDLDELELRAPNDGVLMLASNWSGDKPMLGAALRAGFEYGSLPDAATMEVELALPQIEAQGIRVGAAVEMFPVGLPEQPITAVVAWVASAAKVRSSDNPVKYLTMTAAIPAALVRRYALVPGQRLQARVILLRAATALSVANVAVFGDDGKDYVQVRDGGRFVRREVTLGVRGNARSQVLGGLKPGEQVLLTPAAGTVANDGKAAAEPSRTRPDKAPKA